MHIVSSNHTMCIPRTCVSSGLKSEGNQYSYLLLPAGENETFLADKTILLYLRAFNILPLQQYQLLYVTWIFQFRHHRFKNEKLEQT